MFSEFWYQIENKWCWTDEYVILGTDVCSLFPSLSAEKTRKAVRNQFVKSKVEWSNVDWRLVTLYIKLNEPFWTNDRVYNEIKK